MNRESPVDGFPLNLKSKNIPLIFDRCSLGGKSSFSLSFLSSVESHSVRHHGPIFSSALSPAPAMATVILQPRGPGPGPSPNVLDIPTPPLQHFALFVMFFLPALAVVAVSLRLYTRITRRTLGIGMVSVPPALGRARLCNVHDLLTAISLDDLLCTLALVRRRSTRSTRDSQNLQSY